MTRLSLKTGYCSLENRCVLGRSECDEDNEGVSWKSPAEMEGAPYRAHGGNCLLAETVREMALGSCGSGACAPNEESCDDEDGVAEGIFAPFEYDEYCTAEGTTFGRCGAEDDGRCSWSPDDCGEEEDWTFPAEGCTYDRVRVGGCMGDGVVYCAVSNDGCHDGSTYLNPLEVAARTGVECYMGMEITDPVAPGASGETTEDREGGTLESTYPVEKGVNPNMGDAGGGAAATAGTVPESSSGTADGGSRVPVAVGATVGGVAAAALLLYASILLLRKRRTKTDKLRRLDSTSTGLPRPWKWRRRATTRSPIWTSTSSSCVLGCHQLTSESSMMMVW